MDLDAMYERLLNERATEWAGTPRRGGVLALGRLSTAAARHSRSGTALALRAAARVSTVASDRVLSLADKLHGAMPERTDQLQTDLQTYETVVKRAGPLFERFPLLAADLGEWWIGIAVAADLVAAKPPKAVPELINDYGLLLQEAAVSEPVIARVIIVLNESIEATRFSDS